MVLCESKGDEGAGGVFGSVGGTDVRIWRKASHRV